MKITKKSEEKVGKNRVMHVRVEVMLKNFHCMVYEFILFCIVTSCLVKKQKVKKRKASTKSLPLLAFVTNYRVPDWSGFVELPCLSIVWSQCRCGCDLLLISWLLVLVICVQSFVVLCAVVGYPVRKMPGTSP